jgi:hypothetical protein
MRGARPPVSRSSEQISDAWDGSVDEEGESVPVVRPYFITRGRTRASVDFPLETLVVTTEQGERSGGRLSFERARRVDVCTTARSIAEVAWMLSVPLGVARVLVGDLADEGLIKVYEPGSRDDTALIRRLIDGIRAL